MGAHVITGPDGSRYQINAPDDATPEQLNAVAAQFIQSLPKAPTLPPSAPGATDIATGAIKDIGTGAVVGATDVGRTLLNILPAANRATNRALEVLPGVKPSMQALHETSQRAGEVAGPMYEEAGPMAFAGRAGFHALGTAGAAGPITAATRAATGSFLPKAAAPYVNTMALGATEGAYTNPDAPGTSAAVGAAAGPVLHRVLKIGTGAGRAPDTDILTSAGVNLTPGFASPKRTVAGRLISRAEEGFSTLPIVGDIIKRRQQTAMDQARRAAIEQGQIPGGRPLKEGASVDQMLAQQAEDIAKHRSGAIAGEVFRPDLTGAQRTRDIIYDPKSMMGPDQRAKVQDEIDRLITQQTRPGQNRQPVVGPPTPQQLRPRSVSKEWDPETLLRGQESLRRIAESNKYLGSDDAVKQDMGKAMRAVADEVYELIARQSPRAGAALSAIRPQENVHRIISDVAKKSPKMGEFEFSQLAKAKGIEDVPNLQTFSRAASEFLPATIPEQSAAPRMLWGILALLNPKMAASVGVAGAGFGTNLGSKILLGDTTTQQGIAKLLKRLEVD